MALILSPTATRQPNNPAIDSSSSLAQSLEVVWVGTTRARNILNGTTAATVSNTQSVISCRRGQSQGFSSSAYYSVPSVAGTGPWTIAAIFVIPAGDTSSYFIGTCEAPASATYDRQIGWQGGSTGITSYLYDGSAKTCTAGFTLLGGVPYVVVGATDGAFLYLNVDGVDYTPTAVSNAGYTGYSSPEFCIGDSSGGASAGLKCIPLVVRANRCWSRAERTSFGLNPWQMFAAPRPFYAAGFSAAAGVIKTVDGLALANVKTFDGLAIASVKTVNGVAAV